MKFQRIGTATLLLFILLFVGSSAVAFAADEDMPPPADTTAPTPTVPTPGVSGNPATNPLSEDESIPAPSLGDEALPEPSVDRGQESTKNQVNRPPEDEDIYLPTPNVNDNINYAPVGPSAPRVTSGDSDWRANSETRPIFSAYAGVGQKTYDNTLVTSNYTSGSTVAVSVRLISIAQSAFLHLYGAYSWYSLGNVGSVNNVKDETMHAGPMLEFGLGRRFSLFGSVLRRQSIVNADFGPNRNLNDIGNIGQQANWQLGLGAQWDFYVVPHGSLGLHAHLEQDLYCLMITMAIEPAPRKKLSLNFDDIE